MTVKITKSANTRLGFAERRFNDAYRALDRALDKYSDELRKDRHSDAASVAFEAYLKAIRAERDASIALEDAREE